MKKVNATINAYVTLSLDDDESTQNIIENLEDYIAAQIELDFFPDSVEMEIIDVEEIDA